MRDAEGFIIKCKYSDWQIVDAQDNHDDVCLFYPYYHNLKCYADERCVNYVPDIKKRRIKPMEWELFLIIMGLLMGLCFIGVGICLGRLDKEQHKRADSLEHCLNGDDDHSNSTVGDIYRAEHSGQDTKRPTNRTGEE